MIGLFSCRIQECREKNVEAAGEAGSRFLLILLSFSGRPSNPHLGIHDIG